MIGGFAVDTSGSDRDKCQAFACMVANLRDS